ncbi:GNAT family N-acetyltransferase [Bacteriovorax sp. PP10]|uniref:GNAT family N-acetyltransferase n=1 Tax=Bacteriovorax antarcticus TaxID=3088717 RepID=A0ABU5VSM8_9BACT|nr:GNAT family N-acetyltransferase [Bacteriovorax sp. PP10]MEA9356059.1 GNAT family N-acetyltransferase [Bacteriovorax sp. PP10]
MTETKMVTFNSPEYLAAVKIRKDVFVIEQNIPEELEVDQYEKNCEHFLTKVDGIPAAAGRLRIKDSTIKFERIACLKNYRGTGVGRNLMQKMLEHALSAHPNLTPYMHSQTIAAAFYEKLGWTSEGEVFYEADLPHIAMIYKRQK